MSELCQQEVRVDKQQIKMTVRDFIVTQFLPGEDPESLTDDTLLVTDGVLDSLGSLRLVAFLDETYGITVEAHEVDVDHLDTLDLIAQMVLDKRGN
jgi:acyl carrier protein